MEQKILTLILGVELVIFNIKEKRDGIQGVRYKEKTR